jgi:hypothetical protein
MNNQEAAEEQRATLAREQRINDRLAEAEASIKHLRHCARLQDSATAAVLERAERAEAALELNRAVLAGARNCILKYVPRSIDSDRDFTLSTIKLALERKGV